jgi:hypothetical protein
MIMKAIKDGVPEERIAKALDVNLVRIKEKRNMLKGLCPDVVALLKDKPITGPALVLLRKVKPMRQIEIAELMIGLNNFSQIYMRALQATTSRDDLVNPEETKPTDGLKPEDLNRMRREMDVLEKDIKSVEESYGRNVLDFTLARGYLKKMLDNGKVVRFLSSRHGDILAEFSKILEVSPLE